MNGKWTRISRAEREMLKTLYEHSKGQLAGWLGTRDITVKAWMSGETKQWRSGWSARVEHLHKEVFKPEPTVHSEATGSSLRRLYGLLQTLDASERVLGAVARFILEEEGL